MHHACLWVSFFVCNFTTRYLILSYPIQSYTILYYLILSYPILSYTILSYPIQSYTILSYPILSYPILSYLILSYLILSYLILSYPYFFYRQVQYLFDRSAKSSLCSFTLSCFSSRSFNSFVSLAFTANWAFHTFNVIRDDIIWYMTSHCIDGHKWL